MKIVLKIVTIFYLIGWLFLSFIFLIVLDKTFLIVWLPYTLFGLFLTKQALGKVRKKQNEIPIKQEVKPDTQPVNKSISSIEKRFNELLEANPDLSEEEIKNIIITEEKEKYINQILSQVKMEVNTSPPKKAETKKTLNYTKVRKLVSDFTVLDFETTGLSAEEYSIIQVAAVRYRNFEKVDEYCTYVDPREEIPTRITRLTGIEEDDVIGAPVISEVLGPLLSFIGKDTIVAHNASFDMKFLLHNLDMNNVEYPKFRVIDTLSLARKYIDSSNHKLVTLKKYLKLQQFSSHDALHDCYVTAEVYKHCYENSIIESAK